MQLICRRFLQGLPWPGKCEDDSGDAPWVKCSTERQWIRQWMLGRAFHRLNDCSHVWNERKRERAREAHSPARAPDGNTFFVCW